MQCAFVHEVLLDGCVPEVSAHESQQVYPYDLSLLDGMLEQRSLDDDSQFPTLLRIFLFLYHDQLDE